MRRSAGLGDTGDTFQGRIFGRGLPLSKVVCELKAAVITACIASILFFHVLNRARPKREPPQPEAPQPGSIDLPLLPTVENQEVEEEPSVPAPRKQAVAGRQWIARRLPAPTPWESVSRLERPAPQVLELHGIDRREAFIAIAPGAWKGSIADLFQPLLCPMRSSGARTWSAGRGKWKDCRKSFSSAVRRRFGTISPS